MSFFERTARPTFAVCSVLYLSAESPRPFPFFQPSHILEQTQVLAFITKAKLKGERVLFRRLKLQLRARLRVLNLGWPLILSGMLIIALTVPAWFWPYAAGAALVLVGAVFISG